MSLGFLPQIIEVDELFDGPARQLARLDCEEVFPVQPEASLEIPALFFAPRRHVAIAVHKTARTSWRSAELLPPQRFLYAETALLQKPKGSLIVADVVPHGQGFGIAVEFLVDGCLPDLSK